MPDNPTPRADELPRRITKVVFYIIDSERAFYDICYGYKPRDGESIVPNAATTGQHFDVDGWRISAEPIAPEPVDARTIGEDHNVRLAEFERHKNRTTDHDRANCRFC